MLKFPTLRDREKLDFLKLLIYNLQNDRFFGSKSDIREVEKSYVYGYVNL